MYSDVAESRPLPLRLYVPLLPAFVSEVQDRARIPNWFRPTA